MAQSTSSTTTFFLSIFFLLTTLTSSVTAAAIPPIQPSPPQPSATPSTVTKPSPASSSSSSNKNNNKNSTIYLTAGLVTMAIVCIILLCIYLYTERCKFHNSASAKEQAYQAIIAKHESMAIDDRKGSQSGDVAVPPPTYKQARRDKVLMRGVNVTRMEWHRVEGY